VSKKETVKGRVDAKDRILAAAPTFFLYLLWPKTFKPNFEKATPTLSIPKTENNRFRSKTSTGKAILKTILIFVLLREEVWLPKKNMISWMIPSPINAADRKENTRRNICRGDNSSQTPKSRIK